MKYIILFYILFYIISCVSKEKKITDYSPEEQSRIMEIKDSLMESFEKKSLFDTIGLSNAPVKVLSARLVKQEYSNYKDISITYKNVSKKRIEAIRFRWYGINAFNEPADMGSYGLTKGFGSGFDDNPLSPGKSKTGEWSILSNDGKKVILAWPYEVVFKDGTKWELEK